MNTRTARFLAATALSAAAALAHQPRYPEPGTTHVRNPEISQAFYAELRGAPQLYRIESGESLLLYVQLTVPDIPGVERDYVVDITSRADTAERPVARLRGDSAVWTGFYDPFGGDGYFQGPEYESPVPGGEYLVRVSSPDNLGKYVLVVGKKESFPPGEIARTVAMLPGLKRDYFGKPVTSAYWNYTGLFLGGTAVIVAGVITGIVLLARRR